MGCFVCWAAGGTNTEGNGWAGLAGMGLFFLKIHLSFHGSQNINFENKRCLMLFDIDSNLRVCETKSYDFWLKKAVGFFPCCAPLKLN